MQHKTQPKERSRDYHHLFTSTTGHSVLEDLRDAFDGDLIDDNPYVMACNVGKRDVIKYIEERMEEYAKTQS